MERSGLWSSIFPDIDTVDGAAKAISIGVRTAYSCSVFIAILTLLHLSTISDTHEFIDPGARKLTIIFDLILISPLILLGRRINKQKSKIAAFFLLIYAPGIIFLRLDDGHMRFLGINNLSVRVTCAVIVLFFAVQGFRGSVSRSPRHVSSPE